jgi:hypothetical protein
LRERLSVAHHPSPVADGHPFQVVSIATLSGIYMYFNQILTALASGSLFLPGLNAGFLAENLDESR